MREQLLKQALESGKTTSKKHRNKQASRISSAFASKSNSRATSAANSRAGSTQTSPRNGSRVGSATGSDDELSLSERSSEDGSMDFGRQLEAQLEGLDSWAFALQNWINNIFSRSKRRPDERLTDLRWYIGILQNHYASEEVQQQLQQITTQLLRSSTSEDEEEAKLALKALRITALTDQSEDYVDTCSGPLKSLVQDYGDEKVKADAIRTWAITTYVSGSQKDTVAVLAYLLEIVETDGSRVLAPDSAPVVAAALNAFALLCSQLPDLNPEADFLQDIDREFSQEAIESIAEQLESSATTVQIAAAEAIAVMYEKSYRKATLEDRGNLEEDPQTGELIQVVRKYVPFRNTDQILDQLTDWQNTNGGKSVKKGSRKALRETFKNVNQSLEHPNLGPGFRIGDGWKAPSKDRRNEGLVRNMGPSIRINLGEKDSPYIVEKWWQLVRGRELKSVLGNGFLEHFVHNPVVAESLFSEYDGAASEDASDSDEAEEVEVEAERNGGRHAKSRRGRG